MGFLQGTLARYYKNNSVAAERRSYLKIRTLHPEMRRVCDNNAFVFLHFKKMPFRTSKILSIDSGAEFWKEALIVKWV